LLGRRRDSSEDPREFFGRNSLRLGTATDTRLVGASCTIRLGKTNS